MDPEPRSGSTRSPNWRLREHFPIVIPKFPRRRNGLKSSGVESSQRIAGSRGAAGRTPDFVGCPSGRTISGAEAGVTAGGNPAGGGKPEEARRIASILAGNVEEFHELIRPYERSVYVMALALLKVEADAEEVAQEALLKAFRNLKSFRAEARFGTWLISIALNEARSRLRRGTGVKLESLDEPEEAPGHISPALLRDWREIPSEALERLEVRAALQQAIAALPPIYKEVFLLREAQEMDIRETAEALGISAAAVKVRLHRARLMLQATLAPQLRRLNPGRRRFPWS